MHAVLFLDAVNRSDVGMIERRQHTRLALESGKAVGIGREGLRQDLERHIAPEPAVPRAIDLAHASRAKRGLDLVGAEAGAGGQAHVASMITRAPLKHTRPTLGLVTPRRSFLRGYGLS